MTMRRAKPEILIFLEPWQVGRQFQRQIWVFDHAQLEETNSGRLRQQPPTEMAM